MSLISKMREFIVEEMDVTTVMKVINSHRKYWDYQVGNCGWGGPLATRWFIAFEATDKVYGKIMTDLDKMGEFKVEVRSGGQVDMFFKACDEDEFEEGDELE